MKCKDSCLKDKLCYAIKYWPYCTKLTNPQVPANGTGDDQVCYIRKVPPTGTTTVTETQAGTITVTETPEGTTTVTETPTGTTTVKETPEGTTTVTETPAGTTTVTKTAAGTTVTKIPAATSSTTSSTTPGVTVVGNLILLDPPQLESFGSGHIFKKEIKIYEEN